MDIALSKPNLDIEIVDHLRECIETGWVSTGGRFIEEFEHKIADYVGVSNAVGCQSGTAGLHTALRILGVTAGDEVIVPTLTFIAAVNPVAYLEATPVFMDCDADFCMDAAKLRGFLEEECEVRDAVIATDSTKHCEGLKQSGIPHNHSDYTAEDGSRLYNKSTGKRIAAIVVVHVFGNIADMETIMNLANLYNIPVLEDATEALGSYITGGRYAGRYAGTIGDMGVYSFNANKIITTGGGGMIVAGKDRCSDEGVSLQSGCLADAKTQNAQRIERARYLTTTAKDDGLYFRHDDIGYNYRMLNLQAALGVSQADRLDEFITKKHGVYARYAELLSDIPEVTLLPLKSGIRSNAWFYCLYVADAERATFADKDLVGNTDNTRDKLMAHLIAQGIQARPVWVLCHKQSAYTTFKAYDITQAYDYESNVLNLPCSTSITDEEVRYVCDSIRSYFSHN
ncbi:MAG: DegT/DnrJ/EryC1/StrS family aminotransferase [Clostridiales Family XIII bacterium]|jgi:dTDP-4-amino-4,6-dideoxygalactose transaminase|nr:DegT/DnrJ/EryC1/StrS family aminotransferase [Clostridiales Family XIII bacterium]